MWKDVLKSQQQRQRPRSGGQSQTVVGQREHLLGIPQQEAQLFLPERLNIERSNCCEKFAKLVKQWKDTYTMPEYAEAFHYHKLTCEQVYGLLVQKLIPDVEVNEDSDWFGPVVTGEGNDPYKYGEWVRWDASQQRDVYEPHPRYEEIKQELLDLKERWDNECEGVDNYNTNFPYGGGPRRDE